MSKILKLGENLIRKYSFFYDKRNQTFKVNRLLTPLSLVLRLYYQSQNLQSYKKLQRCQISLILSLVGTDVGEARAKYTVKFLLLGTFLWKFSMASSVQDIENLQEPNPSLRFTTWISDQKFKNSATLKF